MYLHEYQAKELLKSTGVTIMPGTVLSSDSLKEHLSPSTFDGGNKFVVKAQIKAGGRGKAGGIILVSNPQEMQDAAIRLLNKPLVTAQTGPQGEVVKFVYLEKACEGIRQELYISITLDRKLGQLCLVACASGGMEIESLAKQDPSAILKLPIDPFIGIKNYHINILLDFLKLQDASPRLKGNLSKFVRAIYSCYNKYDANMLEINPLGITEQEEVIALDAKISLDDNALDLRQPELKKLESIEGELGGELGGELTETNTSQHLLEQEAKKQGLSYIKLEGEIACIINGAGLAMATMDLVKDLGSYMGSNAAPNMDPGMNSGAEPRGYSVGLANFLDIGGSADKQRVELALRLVTNDPKVKVVLINIFGGIVRCDMIAETLIEVTQKNKFNVPIIVRMNGSNHEKAKQILGQEILKRESLNRETLSTSSPGIICLDDLYKAAQKAVSITRGND